MRLSRCSNQRRMERATLAAANVLPLEERRVGTQFIPGLGDVTYHVLIPRGADARLSLREAGARFIRFREGCPPVEVASMAEDIARLTKVAR